MHWKRCCNRPNEFDDLFNVTFAEDEDDEDFLHNITQHAVCEPKTQELLPVHYWQSCENTEGRHSAALHREMQPIPESANFRQVAILKIACEENTHDKN